MKTTSRGLRNNNPGNIRWGDPWQGLVPAEKRTDRDFCQFVTPAWGIRAMARVLIRYQDAYNLHSVHQIVSRWAPPTENNTPSYIAAVSESMRVDPDAVLNVHDYAVMNALVQGIIRHENGSQPYEQNDIDEGLRLAGVVRSVKSPIQTPTGAAVAVGGGAGLVAAVADGYQQVQPMVTALQAAATGTATSAQWLRVGVAVLVALSIASSAYAYWRHSRSERAVRQ